MYELPTNREILSSTKHLNMTGLQEELYIMGFIAGSNNILIKLNKVKDQEIEELKKKTERLKKENYDTKRI